MKKGTTLIEVLVSIALLLILVSYLSIFFVMENKNYIEFNKNHREELSTKEAVDFIKNELDIRMENLDIQENTIVIRGREFKKKTIKKQQDALVIITENLQDSKGVNVILKKVSNFLVDRKGDNIKVTLKLEGGNEYTRCIKVV